MQGGVLMKKHVLNRATTLVAVPALALTTLLLLFLLLGWTTARATPASAGPMPDALAQTSTFTVSGTVTCEVTGPIASVEVFAWSRAGRSGVRPTESMTSPSSAILQGSQRQA